MMEKHSLNKLKDAWTGHSSELPLVRLYGTFKDDENLYFLTEMMPSKNEVWQ